MNIIELINIHKKYNTDTPTEVHALKDVNLAIRKGEMIAVVGTSGSGKSTLLHIIGCLDRSTSGTYLLENEDIGKKSNKEIAKLRNKKIGFVLQEFGLLLNKSVLENVSYPLLFGDTPLLQIRGLCYETLEKIGIRHLAKRRVEQLSGGQKQRVAIARALINNPDIILADEPTGSLDANTAKEILNIFQELNKSGKTIIIVTHDINVASICLRKINIDDGNVFDLSKEKSTS